MPNFTYKGLNKSGQPAEGSLICNTREEATRQLQQKGIYITSLHQSDAVEKTTVSSDAGGSLFSFRKKRVPRSKIVDFLRQLATLVEAKLPLVRALTALVEQEENEEFNRILTKLREDVQGGATLADAMAAFPREFNRLAVNMVRAGETGGILEQALNRLADFSEEEQDMRSTVKSAMVYPTVLVCVMALAITLLMLFAVPKFKKIYSGTNRELPFLTTALISVADSLRDYWWIYIIVIALIVAGIKYLLRSPKTARTIDGLKFRLPLFGVLTKKLSIARFSRTFGTLVDSGIPILNALNIAKDTAGNMVVEEALDNVSTNVKEGERIAKPLRSSGVFPPVVIHMISVGEESGRLGPMLYRIAENYDKQSRATIKALMTILEPLIIVAMALVVVLIILAMILPMVDMTSMI